MKKITLYITIFVCFFVGIVMLLSGVLRIFGPGLEQTIEHSKVIERKFKVATSYINTYKLKTGRLPSSKEFKIWTSSLPSEPYASSSPKDIDFQIGQYSEDITKQFGQAPKDSYLLIYWRGEWDEYYASWADKTSLEFDESKYYMFGSKYLEGTVVVLIALLTFVCGWLIWRKKSMLFANSTSK